MEKILVTGANGFIGSNLVKRLSENGYQVIGLVRKTSDLSYLEGLNVSIVYGDITDIESLKIATKGIDKVYHVAGLAADWGRYSLFSKINFTGTQNVAISSENNRVKKFTHISTVAMHGFGKVNMNEESPISKKLIPYAETKYLAEDWLWKFAKTSQMKITSIRPGNVFGINDRTFITKYIDALIKGNFAQINKGKSLTCPIYIDNLIDIITLVGDSEIADNNAFIATDGLNIDWQTFNKKLADVLKIKLPKTSIPYHLAYTIALIYFNLHRFFNIKKEPFLTPYRINNGGKDYHFSINKLAQFFDYSPKTNIDSAILKTVEWYKSRR